MCSPQGIIDQLGGLAFCEAIKAGKYILHYEKNLGKLQDDLKDLDDRRECIKIKVLEAIDGGEEIMPDVKTWETKADKLKTDVDQLIGLSTTKGNMHCIACSCPNIKWRYRLSKQAEQKILVVKELTKKGHFDEISHHRPTPLELQFPSDENFVNFDSRTPILDNIVDALKDSSVNMVGVHGLGGVGKTTLVMEVGKKMGLEGYFKQVALATISKGRKVEEVQSQLADGLNFNFDPQKGPRNVQLWKKLTNGDKYLIILDDIWEKVDMKAIGIPIKDEKKGCKVLVTSRNKHLLNTMEVQKNFSIAELPEAEAWDLFKKKVGNTFESQPELNPIGHKVCNKCKGLPVAINAIGEALKDKPDFAWKDALGKLERYELMKIEGIDSTVGASLRLSYDLLGSLNAKSFFLLCCLFREDAEIPIGDLTRHCLARRLFSRDPRTVEEVRDSVCTVIDALKSASLLSNGSHENVVTIHDIIRDVGISIAREENAFFVEQGSRHWPENGPSYSAISLISGRIETLPTKLTCPKLHTLMFENSELSDLKVPNKFFSEMTELSVLILTRMRMQQLPSSLGKLAKLRMLYLIECHLTDIDILGDLNKNLEVLSLRGSRIKELPPKIGQLTSLRVLDLEECDELNVIPRGVVSNSTNLEELYFPSTFSEWVAATDKKHNTSSSSNNVSLEELRQSLTSGQLTILHIYIPDAKLLPEESLKFGNLERFRVSVGCKSYADFSRTKVFKYEGISLRNEFIPLVDKAEVLSLIGIKGLKKMLHDRRVRNGFLDFTSCGDDLEYHIGEPKSSVESHGQNPLQSFNKLIVLLIQTCKLKYLFSPTTAKGLVHLEKLEVKSCEIMEGIVGFEEQNDINEHVGEVKFGKLKRLELNNLPNLVSFYAKKEKTRTTIGSSSAHPLPLFDEKVIFPALERLDISEMGILIEIWDKQSIDVLEEQGSFCQLMAMNVKDCAQLTNVFPSKMHSLLKNLKDLQVEGCGIMNGIVEFEGEVDEDGPIDEVCLSKLIKLRLSYLPSLVTFCTKLGTVGTSNGNATIRAQPLFNKKVAFPSLECLDIIGLLEIKEIWPYKQPLPEPGKETESFYKLSFIRVAGCEQLVYVFPFYILRQLQHLEELLVYSCENLEVIVSEELKEKEVNHNDIVFPQLKTVLLQWLPNLKRFCSETQVFFSDKHAFPGLQIISLSDDLEFLRNGTCTKEVSLEECSTSGKEIETLPKGTSTKEECGTSGKENNDNGEED